MNSIIQKFKVYYQKELFKKSAVSLILKIIGMALGYVVMLYITRVFGEEQWGIYSLSFTVLSIAIVIPKFGFDVSLVRIITELNAFSDQKKIIKVLIKTALIAITLALLVFLILRVFQNSIIQNVLKNGLNNRQLLIISYTIIPSVLWVIVCATFQAFKKTGLFIFFQTVFLNAIFLTLLFLSDYHNLEINIFSLYLCAIAITLIVSIIVLARQFYLKKKPLKTNKISISLKNIFKISTPMLLSGSFALFMGWSDILMLSYFKTTIDVGIYNAALKIAAIAGVTLIAINAIATPKFVEFYTKGDFKGLGGIVKSSTKMIFYTTTPLLLMLILFPQTILSFFGDSFTSAYVALIILCLSRFINAISGSVGYIMQMTDQQKTYQNIIFIAFLINLVLNYFLIPKYSYTGAAIASSIAMVFWNIALVIIIKKRLGFWTIYIPFLNK